jgi:hypothetical protein
MGGTDDPDVDRILRGRANFAHPFLLDRAQQLDLHRKRQVRDLVQEQRAPASDLEKPFPVAVGSGERALAIAEELALHEGLGDRAAIHRDEWTLAPRPVLVDQPGREFLAAPGLAGDVDRRLAAGELLDHRAHLLDRRAFAEELMPCRAAGCGLLGQVEGGLHQRAQLLQRERLRHVVERPCLERGHGVLGAAVRRDDGHRQVGAVGPNVADQLQPFAVGQAHVGQAEVEVRPVLEALERFADGGGALDGQPHA